MHAARLPLGALLLAACAGGPQQVGSAAGSAPDDAAFAAAVAQLRAAPALHGAQLGVLLVDVGSGAVLAEHAADLGFVPASVQKLLTAGVALQTLGADAVFRTRIVGAAPQADGAVAGDLRLVGAGDPSFCDPRSPTPFAAMQALAEQLWARGVRRVHGAIVGDDGALAREPWGRGWQWDDLGEDYAAAPSGLVCHANVVALRVSPGAAEGQPAVVAAQPAFGLPPFANEVRTVAADGATALQWVGPPGPGTACLRGTVALRAAPTRLSVPVAEPARFAAQALRAALLARGIAVDGDARAASTAPPAAATGAVELAQVSSPPLRDLLRPLLKDSSNLHAEQLWRLSAAHALGASGSADAERHANAVLRRLGVATDGLAFADGSGLSRGNVVRPRHVVDLLRAAAGAPFAADFAAALPVAGRDGTLQRRMAAGAAAGRVLAKTGSMQHVAGLAGYVPRSDAKAPPLAFAILTNGWTGPSVEVRAAIDACVEAWAQAAARGSSAPALRDSRD